MVLGCVERARENADGRVRRTQYHGGGVVEASVLESRRGSPAYRETMLPLKALFCVLTVLVITTNCQIIK
jgi:hypothetical protein